MVMTGYEVKSKFLKQDMTEVVVCKELPYTYVQRQLPGNLLDKSDEYLIQRVMDLVNMEYDPSSAIAQLSTLSNEVKERLAKVDDLAVKTEKTSETTQKSLLELTEQVFNLISDLEALKASHYKEVENPATSETAPTTPQPVTETPVASTTSTTEVEHHDKTPNHDNQAESTEHTSTPTDGSIASV